MNEILRRALLGAHLDEVDVAARLEVDPKTVRRWLEGRLPYPRHRWALADLLNVDETDLWPELRATLNDRLRREELRAVYPHRAAIPRETWRTLFESAEREISILDESSLFLAQDAEILHIFMEKAHAGVRVRIVLSDPEGPQVTEHCGQETLEENVTTSIQEAIRRYRPLQRIDGAEIRLHRTVLYNSLYRVDQELFLSQHAYGIPSSEEPIFYLRHCSAGDMATIYLEIFESLWETAGLHGAE